MTSGTSTNPPFGPHYWSLKSNEKEGKKKEKGKPSNCSLTRTQNNQRQLPSNDPRGASDPHYLSNTFTTHNNTSSTTTFATTTASATNTSTYTNSSLKCL